MRYAGISVIAAARAGAFAAVVSRPGFAQHYGSRRYFRAPLAQFVGGDISCTQLASLPPSTAGPGYGAAAGFSSSVWTGVAARRA